MILRVLKLQAYPAAMNMAIDEALIESIGKGESPPTLRCYTWKPSAVSIGYFQSLQEEVDLQACKQKNVEIVRRITGGGAVFHDQELTYSIILPDSLVPKDVLASYQFLCQALVNTFQKLGLHAQFVPINDILITNQKISGNAQTRRNNCVLQHGTILLDIDVDTMFSLLKVPDEKMKGKIISHIKERVTSIHNQLKRRINSEEIVSILINEFANLLNLSFQEGVLTDKELKRAEELKRIKYLNNDWTGKK